MAATPVTPTEPHTAPAPSQRLRFHAAWGLSAAVFLTVGWTAISPFDPRGPVSFLAHAQPSLMAVQVLALVVVTSALATALAGRSFVDIGAVAVGIGLTLASFRGATMTYFLIERADGSGLVAPLAAECMLWFLVMLVALAAAGFVTKWVHGSAVGVERMAASSIPVVQSVLGGAGKDDLKTAVKHVAVLVGVALILIRVLSAGAVDRAVLHGQACFAVAIAFYLAAGRAQLYIPVTSNLWSVLAVPIAALMAMAIAGFVSMNTPIGHLPPLPISAFLRILPIHYVVLGVAAVVFARSKHAPPARSA